MFDYANSSISDEGLENIYNVDYIFGPNEDFSKIAIQIGQQEDLWGNDVNEPTAVAEKIYVNRYDLVTMGTNKDTVKFTKNNVEFIRFKDPNFIDELKQYANFEITVYGKLSRNEFRGKVTGQFLIEDWDIKDTSNEF